MRRIIKEEKIEFYFKLIFFGILLLTVMSIHFFSPNFYNTVYSLATSGNVEEVVIFFQSFGIWAIAISFLIDVLINALGFLPSIFISTANGLLFGIPMGIAVSWVAESIGVVISFLLMRFFLRSTAEKIIEKSNQLKSVDNYSGKNGLKIMAIARTMPYFPSGILTAIGAVSKISVRDYVIATFIGKFPSTAIEVVVGHDLVNYEKNIFRLTVFIFVTVLVYIILICYNKK